MSMFTINLAWPMCEKHALCVGSMPCVLETCSVCGKHAPCVRNMPHVWETCPEFGKQAPCVGNMTLCGKHALCVENDAPCVGNMPHVWQTCPMCGKHAQCVGNMNWVHVMSRMCKVSNFSSLWYQEPHQRHPCPPSPGWILGGHLGSWCTFCRELMSWGCQVSNFRSLGCQEPHQEHGVLMIGVVEVRSH